MAKRADRKEIESRQQRVAMIRDIITASASESQDAFVRTSSRGYFGGFIADLGEGEQWYTLRSELFPKWKYPDGEFESVSPQCSLFWMLRDCQELIEKATKKPKEFDAMAEAFLLGRAVANEHSHKFLIGMGPLLVETAIDKARTAKNLARIKAEQKERQSKGGKKRAKLTDDEWVKVVKERSSRVKRTRLPSTIVSEQISEELERGVFAAIEGYVILSPETIRKKVVGRKVV